VRTELELRHLRVFLTVLETGGYTRAARSLGIAQSTVSETLTALERALGTPLFRKTGKGLMLTRSGEVLVPYARRLLGLSSELVTELAKVSSDVSATLVVAAVESISAYVLPPRLAILRERWPKARMEVITGTCPEIRQSVTTGRCDLGLVLGAEADGGEEEIVAKGRLVICCAPTHMFAGRATTPLELARCDIYMSDAAGDYHQMLRKYFEAAQLPPPRTQALGAIEGVKRGVVANGSAVGLLPAHALIQELHNGTLVEIDLRPPLAGLALRAVAPSGSPASPLGEALVESLRGSLLGPAGKLIPERIR
jgi:DNA-binding transcriptional LysR family regulator